MHSSSSHAGEYAPSRLEHVALPHLGRERHTLEGDERLSETVRAGASGSVCVDVLPPGQEARELALIRGLDLAAKVGEARATDATQHLGIAPLALGAAGQQPSDQLPGALQVAERGSGIDAVAVREPGGHERPVGAGIAARHDHHRVRDRLEERVGSPDGGGTPSASQYRPASSALIQRSSPATSPAHAALSLELGEHRSSRVALGDALLALVLCQVSDAAQDLVKRVAVARPRRLGAVLELSSTSTSAWVDQLGVVLTQPWQPARGDAARRSALGVSPSYMYVAT